MTTKAPQPIGVLQQFRARHGTNFLYRADLSGEVYVQTKCIARSSPVVVTDGQTKIATMQVDAEDLMEFAAHVAGMPLWEPERDPFDKETQRLMVEHVRTCADCEQGDRPGANRCEAYWRLILDRVREKERRAKN